MIEKQAINKDLKKILTNISEMKTIKDDWITYIGLDLINFVNDQKK